MDKNYLIKIFNKIEIDILKYISQSKNIGLSTYKQRQLLDFIRKEVYSTYGFIDKNLPDLIKEEFIKSKLVKYTNQYILNATEIKLIQNIINNYMGQLFEITNNTINNIYKLNNQAKQDAINSASSYYQRELNYSETFLDKIQKEGLVCFTDKGGKNWTYGDYGNMLSRTTVAITQNYGTVFTYDKIDLYQMTSHGTTCPICAPLEGRVYSRSGDNPNYPSMAEAFGKIDKNGSNDVSNTYLTPHPNCLHRMMPFTEENKTEEEIKKIREFSSFETNPKNIDPRSQKEIEDYRNKERGRRKLLNDYKEFKKILLNNPQAPKTFQTFLKHKQLNSEKYKNWKKNI